jgi:large subunit ribosomal protein L30e
MINIDKAIATAVKTGKISFGSNAALQSAKTGKAKMIILANNCPKNIKEQVQYYGGLSNVPVMVYKGDSMDLAAVCNKLFIISALSIRETGDSEILKAMDNSGMQGYTGGTE